MPYDLTLQQYTKPEFYAEPPVEWAVRLREISPVTEKMPHLRFRRRDPKDFWNWPEHPQWELYSCTPRHLVQPDRAQQFGKHWSELPKSEQVGRHAVVSNYQHYMWHTHAVEVRRFWVLQGPNGGTPAQYTPRERRMLDAENIHVEEFPLGFFPACPFDERAVRAVLQRDRFIQAGRNLDALEKMDRPDALRAEDELAEKAFRAAWLKGWFEQIRPQAEFMQSYLRKSESDMTLPRATRATADAVSQWRDHFLETGDIITAEQASSRARSVAIPGASAA